MRNALSVAILVGVVALTGCTGRSGHAAPVGCADARPAASAGPPLPGAVQHLTDFGPGPPEDRLGRVKAGHVVELPPGLSRFSDFGVSPDGQRLGIDLPARISGLRGAGTGTTVLEMTPRSSTAAGNIPTSFPQTNRLSLLRVSSPAVRLSGITLRGTDQGHPYNGLRVQRTAGARITDVCVIGIPGSDHQPPGETFGVADFRTAGSVYRRIRVDGAGVGAAGFGANVSRDVAVIDSVFTRNRYSAGATFWEVTDITLTDVSATHNGLLGLNFERVGGRVRIVRPTLAENGGGDVRIASDFGSARYTIEDPVLPRGRLTVVLPPTYLSRPNLQRAEDVRVLVHGRDRTRDRVRFVRG